MNWEMFTELRVKKESRYKLVCKYHWHNAKEINMLNKKAGSIYIKFLIVAYLWVVEPLENFGFFLHAFYIFQII